MYAEQLQLPFFKKENENPFASLNDRVNFRCNKDIPLHRWVNWVAGFSAPFVQVALNHYIPHNHGHDVVVCDPFAGVGTTLLEATRRRFISIGFEINPWASLVAKTKLSSRDIELREFHRIIAEFNDYMSKIEAIVDEVYVCHPNNIRKMCPIKPNRKPPSGFRSRIPFYSPPVEIKVLLALDFIDAIKDPGIRDLFRVAFGDRMVTFSNYTYEPSLGSRPGAGKPLIDNASVRTALVEKLLVMASDIQSFWAGMHNNHSDWNVITGDFFKYVNDILPASSIDLVITSPPYLNNYHYVRNTRPQLYWLGFGERPSDFSYLSEDNYGQFWQEVREKSPMELSFSLPILEEVAELIRSTKKGDSAYDGSGWVNYVFAYFNDTKQFFNILSTRLKPNGRALIVVGNSLIQGINVDVPKIMGEMAPLSGLETEAIHLIQTKRTGTSIVSSGVRKLPRREKVQLYEAVVVLRRC